MPPRAVQHDAQDHARVRRRDSFARPPSPNRETDRVPLIAPSVRNASPGPRRRRSSPGWAHRHLRDVHHRENASFSRARDPSHDLAFVAVHSAFQPRAELGAGRGGVEPSSARAGRSFEDQVDTFGSNLPVSARLRGEHLERDGDTLAARLPGDVFAASGRIARRDSVDSRASTWAPDEDEDVEGTNAAGSRPSSREWEDEIEDGDERRNTASFLASPVAWSPASPAPRGRRRDA